MTNHLFDDINIKWQTLGDFEHLQYAILDIDEHNKIIYEILDDDLNIICHTRVSGLHQLIQRAKIAVVGLTNTLEGKFHE